MSEIETQRLERCKNALNQKKQIILCEIDMEWQEEMRTNMNNQNRSYRAKSFKKKRIKNKMAKKSRRKNR